jgi:type IV pilus assembly protein PilM
VFAWLKAKKQVVLGIDISSNFVKILELSKKDKFNGEEVYTIEKYGIASLEPNIVVENEIKDIDGLSKTLLELLESVQSPIKTAAIALIGNGVISKIVQLPAGLTAEEIEANIVAESDKYIPYPLVDVYFDFQVIGEHAKNPSFVDVVLVAARKEQIEARMAVLEQAGITLKIVDLEIYAVERAVGLILPSLSHQPRVVATVDIGASVMVLSVLEEGRTVYTREQSFGGRQLTEEIQTRYGLDFKEAVVKQKTGDLPADYDAQVLGPFRHSVAQQVSRLLQLFFSSADSEQAHMSGVDHVLLSGGVANIEGLATVVQEHLKTPTTIADPLVNMRYASSVDPVMMQKQHASLLVCCGLALRSFSS